MREGQRAIRGLLRGGQLRPGRRRCGCGGRLAYGVSTADGCIGWSETERLLFEAAEAVEHTNGGGAA